MTYIRIDTKTKQAKKFVELMETMPFAEIIEGQISTRKVGNKTHPVLKSLKRGLKEVELIKQGKLKATPLKEFLNEL